MSLGFSANQYENAFVPNKLQNWEVPLKHREHPKEPQGFTQIIATDRGHLMEGVGRSEKNPWGDYVGTWDLPQKIPGNRARVPTARASHAADKLKRGTDQANAVLTGQEKNQNRAARNDILYCPPAEALEAPAPPVVDTSDIPPGVPRSPDMTSPPGLPNDRRSPTPPVKSPPLVKPAEPVVAL